jgi:chaperonin GroES
VPIDNSTSVIKFERGESRVRLIQKKHIEARRLLIPMKIRPLGDRILVKRIKEEERTKGGIIIPDTAKEKPQEGKVVAVGKGKMTEQGKLLAPDVKAGDKILFGKYSGSEVKIDDEEHLILREDDILGVLE